jgi:type II secretion system protein N
MRLPQIRMPSIAVPAFLGDRMTWIYLVYTTVLFLVCLLITFPHELLIRRAVSGINRGPLGLDLGTAGFSLYKGYEVGGLRLAPRDIEGQAPLFETTRLWVRPDFSELIRGNPYAASISGELYGGTLSGDVRYKDGGIVGKLAWKDLNLGKYRVLTAQLDEGQIAGKVSGSMDFEMSGANFAQGQATGEISLDGAALTQAKISGFPIPELKLKQTKTKFKVVGGRLDLQDFVTSGDVSIQGSGQVVIKDPVGESVLNLRATIAATPQTPDAIKGAIALIPRPAGAKPDTPITINGTLTRPRIR